VHDSARKPGNCRRSRKPQYPQDEHKRRHCELLIVTHVGVQAVATARETDGGLSLLGHGLIHVGQYRNGMTWLKYLAASRHGYDKNPYEIPVMIWKIELRTN
jgi:hypothetical protein